MSAVRHLQGEGDAMAEASEPTLDHVRAEQETFIRELRNATAIVQQLLGNLESYAMAQGDLKHGLG